MKFGIAFALIFLLQAFTFSLSAQKKTTVPFSKVNGYQPRLNSYPGEGFSPQLFARKEQFDLYFEKVKGASGETKLNFSRYVLLSCYGEKTFTETKLTIEKIVKENGIMSVFFKAAYGKKLNKSTTPSCLYSTAIDRSISGIDYYLNGKLLQELRN
jgi:hypothetical protein